MKLIRGLRDKGIRADCQDGSDEVRLSGLTESDNLVVSMEVVTVVAGLMESDGQDEGALVCCELWFRSGTRCHERCFSAFCYLHPSTQGVRLVCKILAHNKRNCLLLHCLCRCFGQHAQSVSW